jgi:4-amino-4-deoxy-L-arabinose transferase-like glycosyltransferase
MIYGAWVRLAALSAISFWGDDGMTYLGTEAVLRYGYPLLPSGYVNFHTILSFYIRAIPAMLFGLNEFSLRIPSAIMGILAIPVTFLFAKEVLKNKVTALFSAVLIAFSVWQIEFSREVRWYSEFQFFYLFSVYFFYLGFIKGKNIFKILSTVFIILSTFINSLAVSLVFLFVALFIYRGFKGFFKRDSLTHFLIVAAAIAAQIIHRTFFWKVGISFYISSIQSDNPIINALGKFFDAPKPFFTTTFMDMFFWMFLVFVFGAFLWFLSIFIKGMRNDDEQYLDPFGKKSWRAKFPFHVFFIYFLFFANTVFLGVGNMYSQQRYINFAFIYFVIGFCWTVTEIARLLTKPVKTRIKRPAYLLLAAILFFAAASHINPLVSAKIPLQV